MATVALWALNRSLASNISGHWGQTDLEFSPQEILNRSDPEAPQIGLTPRLPDPEAPQTPRLPRLDKFDGPDPLT